MKIKLKKKEKNYAQVHVTMLRDKTLSLKAKGLGAVLESYSNDFEVSLKSIEIGSEDGIKAVRSAIKELEHGYYLFRFQTRDESGLFLTYWAFDSEKLDLEYLHEMIAELEKVELITQLDGVSLLGTPTGYPLSASRSTASRQRTTYNNINNKTKKDKNISLGNRESIFSSISSFKKHFIQKNTGVPFPTKDIGYKPNTLFKIDDNGYIVNLVTGKLLSANEAYSVWNYLYSYYLKESKTA